MPSISGITISKSRYISGVQCGKRVWTEQHARDLLPEIDDATQARFDQGHEVGRLATGLFPGGLEVCPGPRRWSDLSSATFKALPLRQPLYEAGFVYEDAGCRVDILVPRGSDRWDVVEVKSSTKVKDVDLDDLAFQGHVVEGAGVSVRDYYLVHLDSSYTRRGEIELDRLFEQERVTEEVRARMAEVPGRLDRVRSFLTEPSRPEVEIGEHCDRPFACPLKPECWSFLPDHNVFELYGSHKKGFELLQSGVSELIAVPETTLLTENQQRQIAALKRGEPWVEEEKLKTFVESLTYPLYFFDIETFSTAVPRFDGLRPYQQVPFLFSIHRIEKPAEEARHFAHLVRSEGDPRDEFLRAASVALGPRGTILAYNSPFETRVLVETSAGTGELEQWALDVTDRFVDLLDPFRAFNYYHPEQRGSASLKNVLPVLTGMSYEDLEIQDGEEASRQYLRVMQPGYDPVERSSILNSLEAYCSLDTLGMVAILDKLTELQS